MCIRVASLLPLMFGISLAGCVSGTDDLGLSPRTDVGPATSQVATFSPVNGLSSANAQQDDYPQTVVQPTESAPYDPQISAIEENVTAPDSIEVASLAPQPPAGVAAYSNGDVTASIADPDNYDLGIYEPPKPRFQKTYLINGLASAVPFIGYGFTNLSKKIPNSRLFSYGTPIEGSTVIRSSVMRDIKKAYQLNPDVEINLIGISYGANVVTSIAAELNKKNIPVHYLATVDGPMPRPVTANVKTADNFTCTNLDCFKVSLKLKKNNNSTALSNFKLPTSHIPLGNDKQFHDRVLQQIENTPFG